MVDLPSNPRPTPHTQARLDRLAARLSFLDKMAGREDLPPLDRHLYACEAAHWRVEMPRIAARDA